MDKALNLIFYNMKTLNFFLFVTVSFAQIRGKVVDFNGKLL
jgi:hypothetical protein